MKTSTLFFCFTAISASSAFTGTVQKPVTSAVTRLEAGKFDPLGLAAEEDAPSSSSKAIAISTAFAATLVASPLAAVAEGDDYEYGAVDAPIGLAWAAGLLAILTAAVPVLLQGGEKALEQQRIDEGGTFGKSEDVLKKRR
mmetsp:Transcript_8156/g.17665  ORF Transcript_8156/g.17665 Transcript_8156/m.17665 type:complete len:141 (-) Transcript_8156:272-694(-)